MMYERAIEISQTYTPGKSFGNTRTITIDRIPAIEMTLDGESSVGIEPAVCERLEALRARALRSNDAAHQSITYTASDRGASAARGVLAVGG